VPAARAGHLERRRRARHAGGRSSLSRRSDVCNPSHWRDTASPPMFRIVCDVPRPGVKPRAADIQHAAHQLDRVLGLLCGDEPERSRAPRWACGPRGAAAAGRRARRSSGPPRGPRRRGSGGSNCAATAARPPSSAASCGTVLPLPLSRLTTSRRNSGEYGAGLNTRRSQFLSARLRAIV
jgi:hypothetical protein